MSPSPRPPFRVPLVLLSLVAVLVGACSSAGGRRASRCVTDAAPPTAARHRHRPPAHARPPPSRSASPTTRAPRSTLDAEPQKIVSLTPAATETLFASAPATASSRPTTAATIPPKPRRSPTSRRSRRSTSRRSSASPPTSSSPAGSASPRPTRSPSSARSGSRSSSSMRRRSTASTRTSSCSATRPGRPTRPTPSPTGMRTDMRRRRDGRSAAAAARLQAAGLLRARLRHDDRRDLRPGDDSFLAEMVALARRRRDHDGDPTTYEIPLETAHRARPTGHRPRRQRLLQADGRGGRQAAPAGTP